MKKGIFAALIFFSGKISAILSLQKLSLQDAEEIALSENKPYLISLEDIYQADQRRLQAYSEWFPKITYSSFLARTIEPTLVENVSDGTFFFKKNLVSNKFELTQTLFSSEVLYNIKTRSLEKKSSEAMNQKNKNDLLLDVRNYYYSVVLFKAALAIQRENAEYLTDALKVEQGKYQFGNATSLEVNQSKVAVSNSISIYYNTLKKWKNARNALVDSLGIEPILESEIEVKDETIPITSVHLIRDKVCELESRYNYPPDSFPLTRDFLGKIQEIEQAKKLTLFTEKEVEDYIITAIEERPELQVKKLMVDIASDEVGRSYGEYLPKITGFVDYQKNAGDPASRLFTRDDFSWAMGVRISWDLFDSLLRERKIKEALSKRVSSRLSYKYSLDNVEIAIRNALYQIEDAIYAYHYATESVLVAEQAMVQAREKLQFGKIPPLDYRDAANQLAQAKNLQNTASFQLMMAYYQLRYDIGIDVK